MEVAESPLYLPVVPGQARRHVDSIRDKVRGFPGVITPDLALAAAHCSREGHPKLSWTFPSSWVVVLGGPLVVIKAERGPEHPRQSWEVWPSRKPPVTYWVDKTKKVLTCSVDQDVGKWAIHTLWESNPTFFEKN